MPMFRCFRLLRYAVLMSMNMLRNKIAVAPPIRVTMDDGVFSAVFEIPFRTVIDVGAHAGEFVALAHRHVPAARVFAFEPLTGAHRTLERVIEKCAPGSRLFPFAAGDAEAVMEMTEYPFTPCSSLLPAAKGALLLVPYMIGGMRRPVRVRRLDDVLDRSAFERPILMKLDVQGYEDRVLRGANLTLDSVDSLIIETSFIRLYEGQWLFADVRRWLEERGFAYTCALQQHRAFLRNTVLQEDSLFTRVIR